MIYQGDTTHLIVQPGDSYSVDPNGLITLVRTYACATTYATTAASTLSLGYSPDDHTSLNLFTKSRADANGVTIFTCTFHGATGASKKLITKVTRSFDVNTPPASGNYYSPTWTIEKAVDAGGDTISAPTLSNMGGVYIFKLTKSPYIFINGTNDGLVLNTTPTTNLDLEFEVSLVSLTRTNFGSFDVLSKVFSLTSAYG